MILLLITGILLFIYIVLLLYYWHSWKSIPEFHPASHPPEIFITVIVPARNEEKNLPQLLQSLRSQSYPSQNFEVIIVDDHSTDNTSAVARDFVMQNLKIIYLTDMVKMPLNSYKKKGIEIAIGQAKGELIVSTDADCKVPVDWLLTIASFYDKRKANFIVMPVSMNYSRNFLEIFQSLDFMSLQGITGAGVYKRFHNMCNGANIAYTKEAFMKAGGFQGIDDIASGDDMLLMQKINLINPSKIGYLKTPDVIVQTSPMLSVKEFLNQRIRWASKAGRYKDYRITVVLLTVYLLNVSMLLIPFAAAFNNQIDLFGKSSSMILLWACLLAVKVIFELIFLYPVAGFFKRQNLLFIFPLLQPFHILYTVIAGLLGRWGSYNWKGRTVK